MPAVPAVYDFIATVQDGHGDIAVVRFPGFDQDFSTDATAISALYTEANALFTALAACMNGKIVKESVSISYNRAQKPAGPLSTYAHVYQQVFLDFGDGSLERTRITIPTPKTSCTLTDGVTANPADTNVAALIAAVEANCASRGSRAFNEYLGGRFREGKPRRRTNLYNAVA